MDINTWIEVIYKYGPYALLVLFVFWVAPKQIKAFKDCAKDDKGSRVLCGSFAVVSWMVIVLMTGYIFINWSSTEVYTGTLGKYETQDNVEFYSVDQDSYVSTAFISGTRMEWKFAVLADDSLQNDQQQYVTFTYRRKGMEYDHEILLADLKNSNPKFYVDVDDPQRMFFDHDNNPATPAVIYAPNVSPSLSYNNTNSAGYKNASQSGGWGYLLDHWMAAFAAEPGNPQDMNPQEIINDLNSDNKYLRANARKKLRTMSLSALNDMLDQTASNSQANLQIAQEIEFRSNGG